MAVATTFSPVLLREQREKQKLSTRILAMRCGVSWRTVHTWEDGTRTPNSTHLARLTEVLDCPVSTFFRPGQP